MNMAIASRSFPRTGCSSRTARTMSRCWTPPSGESWRCPPWTRTPSPPWLISRLFTIVNKNHMRKDPTSAGRGKLAEGNSPLPRSRWPLRADEPKVSLGLIWCLLYATSIYVWLGFEVNRGTQSVLGIDLIIWRLLDVTSIYVWHESKVDSRWAQIVLGIDLIIC